MNIIFVDDSISFDGFTPSTRPLGSAEKAFAHLPPAMARRGHAVRAYSRCDGPVMVQGAGWHPVDGDRIPERCDVLVAFRKPSLLDFVKRADRRFLWLAGSAGYLDKPAVRTRLQSTRPMLLLHGLEHQATLPKSAQALRTAILPHGVSTPFVSADDMAPATPPRAVVTTHPLAGLDWLLDVWTTRIRVGSPRAELHVFSASLAQGAAAGEIAEPYREIRDRCTGVADAGVVLRTPLPDPEMAEVYRTSRVHLYPGHAGEVYCGTLAESQAVGLPAVARPLGATLDRIENGRTGFIAPDDEAFANLAVRLLEDDDTFRQTSANARRTQRKWTWDKVAAELDALLG